MRHCCIMRNENDNDRVPSLTEFSNERLLKINQYYTVKRIISY